MKVAVFCTQFGYVRSGPGRFVEYLRAARYKDIGLTFFSDQIEEESPTEVPVTYNKRLGRLPFYWILRNYYYYLAIRKRTDEYDAILCTSALEALWLIGLRKKLPVLVMVNDYKIAVAHENVLRSGGTFGYKKTAARLLHRLFEAPICARASRVITNSKFTTQLVRRGYNLPDVRLDLLYKGVDLSAFVPPSSRPALPRRLLFLKNDWQLGGLTNIINVVGRLPSADRWKITVAGIDEADIPAVTRILSVAGPGITDHTVLGIQNRGEVIKLLQNHDLLVSMTRQEALGVSCLEAMATELPVIAPRVGGLPEVLDEGRAGFLIELSEAALARCLSAIRDNPTLMNEKITGARTQVQKFSVEAMLDRLRSILLPFDPDRT